MTFNAEKVLNRRLIHEFFTEHPRLARVEGDKIYYDWFGIVPTSMALTNRGFRVGPGVEQKKGKKSKQKLDENRVIVQHMIPFLRIDDSLDGYHQKDASDVMAIRASILLRRKI